MNWILDTKTDICYKIKKFNSTYYKLTMQVEHFNKTIKTWVSVSSAKKRKHLDNVEFEYDLEGVKRDGGIKALLWIKNEILNFYNDYNKDYKTELYDKLYICIHWSNNKRRNVYSRLQKEGFYFMNDENCKILMKEIKVKNNEFI